MLLYWHPIPADDTLSVQLYPLAGGASIADEELADTTTPPGLYAADIGSPAEGTYAVRVLKGAAVIYQGLITITGPGPHVVDVTAQEVSVQQAIAAIGDIEGVSGNVTVYITPLSAGEQQRVKDRAITLDLGDSSPVTVYGLTDATGQLVDLNAVGDLRLVIEEHDGTDLQVIDDADILRSGESHEHFTFAPSVDVVGSLTTVDRPRRWALRLVENNKVLAKGPLKVERAALADP